MVVIKAVFLTGERSRRQTTDYSPRNTGPGQSYATNAIEPQAEPVVRERIPLAQLISLAVTQSVGVWSRESYVAHRAQGASRAAFDEALAEVPDVPPMPGDEMPK
jgi:hypothetical protein